jgi:hypothetical protein
MTQQQRCRACQSRIVCFAAAAWCMLFTKPGCYWILSCHLSPILPTYTLNATLLGWLPLLTMLWCFCLCFLLAAQPAAGRQGYVFQEPGGGSGQRGGHVNAVQCNW